jgi:hypothetical protein
VTPARWRAIVPALALIVGAAAFALSVTREPAASRAEAERGKPVLMLLTSLPLMFGEDFSLDSGGSPALAALGQRYRVVPISVTSTADLAKGRMLLMAQPQAQTPADLVALDRWVRDGGRLLLLADPLLEWPSARPLGDALRPPPMFADTGLLAHWGLRLDSPEERGPKMSRLGGREIMTASPGTLHGRCKIDDGLLVARCRIGRGSATIIADADFLGVQHLDGPIESNLPALVQELSLVEPK